MTLDYNDLVIPDAPQSHEPERAAANSGEAKCLAFLGGCGGVGVTSIAIETAYNAMKLGRASGQAPARVCLIDLDFETGALSTYLDIAPAISPEVLAGDPARIDPALTSALISKHGSGLRLLSGPGGLGGNEAVNPDCILALMDAASTMYDVLILDVPRLWRPWTQAALCAADSAMLVTELTIPALHMARTRIHDIETAMSLPQPLKVILSKYERRSFRAAVSLKDAQAALGRDVSGFVCIDPETPRDAMNCGEPSGCVHPDSRFSKDVASLTSKLLSEPEATPIRQPARRNRRRSAR